MFFHLLGLQCTNSKTGLIYLEKRDINTENLHGLHYHFSSSSIANSNTSKRAGIDVKHHIIRLAH